MGMNPDTNKFEELSREIPNELKTELDKRVEDLKDAVARQADPVLYRPDGSSVPKHWAVFQIGEHVVIKDYTFKVSYIGETAILFEPVGPVAVEGKTMDTVTFDATK